MSAERQHPDREAMAWEPPKPVLRDEIHTENIEYAMVLTSILREHGKVPHDGHLWRVMQIDRKDHSQVEHYNGLFGGEPCTFRVPAPPTFVFLLERDA